MDPENSHKAAPVETSSSDLEVSANEREMPVGATGSERSLAWTSLCLLVPAPTIGVLFALWLAAGTTFGSVVYLLCKLWLLALPAVWYLVVDGGRIRFSILQNPQGWMVGAVSGGVIGAVILLTWLLAPAEWIDAERFRQTAAANGLDHLIPYMVFAIATVTLNAVMEEYVWRWFVLRQSRRVLGAVPGQSLLATLMASAFFTLHHVIALKAYFPWSATLVASLGVFIAGLVWCALYIYYRSIWPGYVSHALVNIGMFVVGFWIIFG